MDRFMQRDNNLLVRYNPQRSVMDPGSSSSSSSLRNSEDVDFHDVFGGPPRRCSSQDVRTSIGEATELRRFRGEDEGASSSIRWSGLGDKPVFGEEDGNRRRGTSEDFFDDIFGGEVKDPYSSSPGSRIMSPARPLPARTEPFGSSSHLVQFSLPAKLNKGIDFPSLASANRSPYNIKNDGPNGLNYPYSPSGSLPRLSSQSFEGQNESRNDTRSSYRQSPLSIEFSLSADGSVKVTDSETNSRKTAQKDLKCSDVPANSNQFHFSIYKWASKGVPLMTSLRSSKGSRLKEDNLSRCLSSNGRIERDNMVCELPTETHSDVDFSFSDSVSGNTESNRMESKNEDNELLINTSIQDKLEQCQSIKEAVLAVPKHKPLDILQSTFKDIPENTISSLTEENKPNSVPEKSCEQMEKVITKFVDEARKPKQKPLRSMLFEDEDGQGKYETSREVGVKGNMEKTSKKVSGNVSVGRITKKRDGKRTIHNDAEVDKASLHGSPAHIGDNLERNKIKGKVKEFVKIFNQEAPSKRVTNADTQSQSSRRKDAEALKAEKEVYVNTTRADEILRTPTNMDKKKASVRTSVQVDAHSKQSKEQDSGIDTTIPIFNDAYEQKDSLSSTTSITDSSKATLASVDDFFEDDFSVKELSQDQNMLPQSGKDEDDFKASDAKIRGWSNGKETNIRSLLSTLQYVLWPESGWKPVPLVDVIDGNAVKKAYQKALLCLHPDKLQQKGAAAHQKYIAEKVFDILQDAWTHFNLLGSL